MSSQEQFTKLRDRVNSLQQRRAVLIAQQEQRDKEREQLCKELAEMGIDPTNPGAEIERIERELTVQYAQQQVAVDAFERELTEAEAGRLPDTETKPNPVPVSTPAISPLSVLSVVVKPVPPPTPTILDDLEIG